MSTTQQPRNRLRAYMLFAAIFFFMASFFLSSVTSNVNTFAAWYGRADHQGYFDNGYEKGYIPQYTSCGNLAPVLPNNCYSVNSIPDVSNVDQFFNFLQSRYNSTDNGQYVGAPKAQQWNKTGVAFIVNSMLGRNGGAGTSRDVSASDWTELHQRLAFINANGSVDFNATLNISDYGYVNTFYQYNNNDVSNLTQSNQETSRGIKFTYGGKTVFALYYKCANPLGDLPGLPDINFSLNPTITGTPGPVESGDTVSYTPTVSNGGSTTSASAQWQTVTFTVPSGTAVPAGNTNGSKTPVQYYGNGATVIGSGTKAFPKGPTQVGAGSKNVGDLPVGSQLCFALAVQPYKQDSADWKYSKPICVKIGKEPKLQILGGDLRVGGAFVGGTAVKSNIETSVSIKTNKSYGSWAEYALMAPGTITGAGSGSAYSGGIDCSSSCATNNLSFANSPKVGGFVSATNIPDVASSFPVSSTTPKFSTLADAALKRVETATGTITISGGTIAKGQWLVINAPQATVTIAGDINYANTPLSRIADIPQLIIIANQINIQGNVKNVDAWLIASGTTGSINTCSTSGANNAQAITSATKLSTALCQNPLVINGPVMAKKLYLLRTAGADAKEKSGDPAEVINLRPDAYLWGITQASPDARLDTSSTQELPPRF